MRKLKMIMLGIWQLFTLPILYLPGPVGNRLRYLYYKSRLRHLGRNVIIDVGVYIQNPEFVSIDDNTWIDRYVILLAGPPRGKRETLLRVNKNFTLKPGELFIGKNVHIAPYSIISAIGGVHIGNDVTLSSGCKIYSFSHHYRSAKNPSKVISFGSQVDPDKQCMIQGPVVIQDNVGLALNCVVLPGVTIHQNSFIFINSVVHSDIPENSLTAGNPAKVLKERFPKAALGEADLT